MCRREQIELEMLNFTRNDVFWENVFADTTANSLLVCTFSRPSDGYIKMARIVCVSKDRIKSVCLYKISRMFYAMVGGANLEFTLPLSLSPSPCPHY